MHLSTLIKVMEQQATARDPAHTRRVGGALPRPACSDSMARRVIPAGLVLFLPYSIVKDRQSKMGLGLPVGVSAEILHT
jgi:hypothetical protein